MKLSSLILLKSLCVLLCLNTCSNDETNPVGAYVPSNFDPSEQPYIEPCPEIGKVYYQGGPYKDESGNYYNTVLIGEQCWLRENLNVGKMIYVTGDMSDDEINEKYCYNNNELNCDEYGGLYQWNEAMKHVTGSRAQGICPSGWHIPNKHEFEILGRYVNEEYVKLIAVGQPCTTLNPTNEHGFSALLAGHRSYRDPKFNALGKGTTFWTSFGDRYAAIYLTFGCDGGRTWVDSYK